MNDFQIRAAFPLTEEPASLNAKIDGALAAQVELRPAPRRFALGFTLTVAIATLVFLPTRPAQASFVSILGALESSEHVRIVISTVLANGHQAVQRTIDVDGVDQHTYDRLGRVDEYGIGTRLIAYDPLLKAFVESPRRTGREMQKIWFTLGKGVYNGMESEVARSVQNGTEVLRATVSPKGGNVRFIFDASPVTRRPFLEIRQSKTKEGWRTMEVARFAYDVPFRTTPPPTGVPRLSPAQAEAQYRDVLLKTPVAVASLGKSCLTIRRLDVARDGTTFVAFQRGPEESGGFRGYTFRLTDDLGTEYVRVGTTLVRRFSAVLNPGGPFEMEVFSPRKPVKSWSPRHLRLQAHRFEDGTWAGTLERTQRGPDRVLRPWPGFSKRHGARSIRNRSTCR